MKFWWVNHKQTFRQEIDGEYLWSPKRESNGAFSQYYANMRVATRGDVVLSYANTVITYVGVITDDAISAPKPHEFGATGQYWSDEGWRLPVLWTKLATPVSPKSLFAALQPLLPAKYSPLTKTGDGAQKAYFSQVSEDAVRLILSAGSVSLESIQSSLPGPAFNAIENELSDEIDAAIQADKNLSDTEKKELVLARRGQGLFRRNVAKIELKCRITGVANPALLTASHIMPWRSCQTATQRLDGANGLLLTPSVDRLFDRGWISFSDDGQILVSPRIDPLDLKRLGIDPTSNVGKFSPSQCVYLGHHRDNVFLP